MEINNETLVLVDTLVTNFSVEALSDFVFNKFPEFDYIDQDLSEFSNEHFSNLQLLGKTKLADGADFCVVSVEHSGELSERSSKRRQYDLAKRILRNYLLDAGFFVFYDNGGNFRFSLVYTIYKGTRREYNYFKRYTYFVEQGKPYRTFLKSLTEIDCSNLNSIIQAFSPIPLTKEFYTEIQNWYAWALDKVQFPGGKAEDNLIRLISRLIFVWFLKQKKLIPDILFDENELKKIVKDFKKSDYYYNAILQNLFFATLNTEPHQRSFASFGDFFSERNQFGLKTFFRYQDKILISEREFIDLFKDVPFINGGLFECLDDDVNYIDGFSRNEVKRAKIPDKLFFSDFEKQNLENFFGESTPRTVRGLINILKDYNFTTDESSPIDIEVSLDPELLGHIFENLLATYNPETGITARKATGSFYTPKEIVEFMVDASLTEYFKNRTNLNENLLSELLSYSETPVPLSQDDKEKLLNAIYNLKILDPAVGSGAFPMGIVHKLAHLLAKIDPDNTLWQKFQLQKAYELIQKATSSSESDIKHILDELISNFDETLNYPDYSRKIYLIENSIYGVDIQTIAIQICKLRFFLSLLIDQKVDPSKPNFGIKPLPHLETKFITANTLIALNVEQAISFGESQIFELKEKLKHLYQQHFRVKTRKEKKKIQTEAEKIRENIKNILLENRWNTKEADEIANFDIFSQTATADWFDPEWMFGVSDGFDIVIGNPPYIQLQKGARKLGNLYQNQNYETFVRTGDIYALFYEKGMKLLKPNGILCYISSNKWMRAGYGEKLRNFFIKYNPLLLVDLGPGIFENATVDTCILMLENTPGPSTRGEVNTPSPSLRGEVNTPGPSTRGEMEAAGSSARGEDTAQFPSGRGDKGVFKVRAVTLRDKGALSNLWDYVRENSIVLSKLSSGPWFIGSSAEQQLKEKIERIGKPLKEWDVKIYRGISTGLNEAFIIDTEKRNEILANCKTEDERRRTEAIIKPILRGRDIKRYYYEWAGLWVLVIPWHFPLHEDNTIHGASEKAEIEFRKQYPAVYSHILNYKDALSKRNKDETGIRYEWYALQRCAATYYHEFEKEKVVWQRITQEPTFSLVKSNMFILDSMAFFTGNNLSFTMASLNSKLIHYYVKMIVHQYGFTGFRLSNQYVEIMPLPIITKENQPIVNQIEALVDKILSAKKSLPSADTSQWEHEIDQLVYQLYNLTDDEIKIVEELSDEVG